MHTEMFRYYSRLEFEPGQLKAALSEVITRFSIKPAPEVKFYYKTSEMTQIGEGTLDDLLPISSLKNELWEIQFRAFGLREKIRSHHSITLSRSDEFLKIHAYSLNPSELPGIFSILESFLNLSSIRAYPSPGQGFIEYKERAFLFKAVSDFIGQICNGFNLFARRLKNRRDGKPSIQIIDEYDVQDFFHAILLLHFSDIRPEEWTPSYAGGSSRIDFLLPVEKTVIEIKKTRATLKDRKLGEELLVDIAKYKIHPQCKRLICFVYDPEGVINNPIGLERDLSSNDGNFKVDVFIRPQGV